MALIDRAWDEAHRAGPLAARALLLASDDRDHPFVLMAMGTLDAAAGELDRGIATLERAAALAPDIAIIHNNLGAALIERIQSRGPDAAGLARAIATLERAAALGLGAALPNLARAKALATG